MKTNRKPFPRLQREIDQEERTLRAYKLVLEYVRGTSFRLGWKVVK